MTEGTVTTIHAVTLALYAVAFAALLRLFLAALHEAPAATIVAVGAAFVAHCGLLVARAWELGYAPVIGMADALSFIAWSATLCYLFLLKRVRALSLGVFVLPFGIAFLFLSLALGPSGPPSPELAEKIEGRMVLFTFHMASALFSYSCFAVAFAGGLMYALLDREIHGRRLGYFSRRVPSLETLDRVNTNAMGLGLVCLAAGIVSGAVALAKVGEGLQWRDDPKVVSAIVIWFAYAVTLVMAVHGGWRGRRAAIVSCVIFCLVFVLYFIVNLMFAEFHGAL